MLFTYRYMPLYQIINDTYIDTLTIYIKATDSFL